MFPAKYSLMHCWRPSGGSPSFHMLIRQLLRALATPPVTAQPGHVSCEPSPPHLPADWCATIAVASDCAPMSEHISALAVARFRGASIFIARYMLMVSTHV